MGFLIFLLVVIAIIVLIVVLKKIKRKKTFKKAIEELKNSEKYAIALQIKKALEDKGGNFGDGEEGILKPYLSTNWKHNHQAYGIFYMSIPPSEKTCLTIFFSEYKFPVEERKDSLLKSTTDTYSVIKKDHRCFLVNNAGFVISSEDEYNEKVILEYLKIAADVLIAFGAGLGELYIDGKLIEAR